MIDQDLEQLWTALEPTQEQSRRIRTRVFAWIDARDTSLVAEWLGLIKVNPFASLGLAAVSAVSILLATPVLWLARALM